jgi:hypothetical protein
MRWPSAPEGDSKVQQALFQAKLDDERAARDHERQAQAAADEQDWQRLKLLLDSEQTLRRQVHEAKLSVTKGSLDRARGAAEFVRNAASALVSLYTAVIGASFAVTKQPLPTRGLISPIFLGSAVVFSAAYVAFATRPRETPGWDPTSEWLEREQRRLDAFVTWINEIATRRLYALHMSVLSLGFGAFFLPAAITVAVPAVTSDKVRPAELTAAVRKRLTESRERLKSRRATP